MKKTSAAPASTPPAVSERRGSRRCKITQVMRIRPSDPEKTYFDDLRGTVSVSRSGIYFHTTELGYEVGQRLFVTMPYPGDPSTIGREYLAEVVRKDVLENGMIGIGFKTLIEITERSYSFDAPGQQN
ncbi:MAG TPA: PilZ domain-containing protein [Candidatus Acidoferrales bacterium]|nr:PilZ domain-containing protein [Candidatus Acidoferrales bacterium]